MSRQRALITGITGQDGSYLAGFLLNQRSAVGYEGEIQWDPSYPDGQPRGRLDVSRARELFGFEARTPLEEGLGKTVGWF